MKFYKDIKTNKIVIVNNKDINSIKFMIFHRMVRKNKNLNTFYDSLLDRDIVNILEYYETKEKIKDFINLTEVLNSKEKLKELIKYCEKNKERYIKNYNLFDASIEQTVINIISLFLFDLIKGKKR